jgi:hypothetical protein
MEWDVDLSLFVCLYGSFWASILLEFLLQHAMATSLSTRLRAVADRCCQVPFFVFGIVLLAIAQSDRPFFGSPSFASLVFLCQSGWSFFRESVIEIVVQLVVVLVTLFLDLGQDEEFEASESSIREILGFLTTWSSGKHQPRIGLPSASKHCSRL